MIYGSVDHRNVALSEITFWRLFFVPTIKNPLNLETSLICFSLEWLAHAFCGATPSHGIARFVLFLATYRLRILDLHMPSQNLCQVFTAMTTFAISESPVLSMAAFLYPSFGKAKKRVPQHRRQSPRRKARRTICLQHPSTPAKDRQEWIYNQILYAKTIFGIQLSTSM
jgi:hypothetical protein